MKIHKLDPKELKPGCDIPVRLITCLQEGVTKRSDVFIAHKWLKQLAKDYCKDLVSDSTDTLRWLDTIEEKSKKSKRHFKPFTFDFDALYDRLDPIRVIKAIRDAMTTCRPEWSPAFMDWMVDLILLSINSAFGEFQGKFYKAKKGIATGGSICVELANITVYYIMKEVLYEDKKLMRDIVDIKRFIDDGVGMHCMSDRRFTIWTKTISDKVEEHKMKIKPTDWTVPSKEHGPVNFLDILFSFDERKALQTDLFQKPTDSRSYLNFNSCHPNYTFSGNVTSQALRLRRIINNDERLAERLDELEQDFTKCGYPQKMLKNILDKVKKKP